MRRLTFKNTFKLKLFVLRKLISSKKFMFIDFKKTSKEEGYAEGYFSPGFRDGHINGLMTIAQDVQIDSIRLENMESTVEEAKQLIKN